MPNDVLVPPDPNALPFKIFNLKFDAATRKATVSITASPFGMISVSEFPFNAPDSATKAEIDRRLLEMARDYLRFAAQFIQTQISD